MIEYAEKRTKQEWKNKKGREMPIQTNKKWEKKDKEA